MAERGAPEGARPGEAAAAGAGADAGAGAGTGTGTGGTGTGTGGWRREALAQRIFEILRDELLDVGPEFTPRSDLVEAGLDSLAVTQLLLALEEETGVWVDESLLTPEHLESAEALAALVHAKLRGD